MSMTEIQGRLTNEVPAGRIIIRARATRAHQQAEYGLAVDSDTDTDTDDHPRSMELDMIRAP